MKRIIALFFAFLIIPHMAGATVVQEVHSKGGITAWLVEDHKLPMTVISFAFRGGVEQDSAEKQGLAALTMTMMTEGAGEYDANALRQVLADHSISLGFDAGRDALQGGVRFLSEDRDLATDIVRQVLLSPKFSADDLERVRGQQLAAIRAQLGEPSWQARYALLQTIFHDHPYAQRRLGSEETLASITRDDVVAFAHDHLAKDNLVVAIAGDMGPGDVAVMLDKVFGNLPEKAKLSSIAEVQWPDRSETKLVRRDGTQTNIVFAMPGPKRDAPDWYATEVANYIIGGGGFSSRLMHKIRDENGLTYGIGTGLSAMDHGAMIIGEAATDNDKTAKAFGLTQLVLDYAYKNGVTEEEVAAAKNYLIGALPLTLTSLGKIADVVLTMQLENLGRDYLDKRSKELATVTKADVDNAIKRWFNPAVLFTAMAGEPVDTKVDETLSPVKQ